MTFIESVKSLFLNYANFGGRTSRSGFWWAQLLIVAPAAFFSLIDVTVLSTLWTLATVVPALSVLARRLHDSGKSAWFILLGLIPFFGVLALIILAVLPSEPAENRFGPTPDNSAAEREFGAAAPSQSAGVSAMTNVVAPQGGASGSEVAFDLSGPDRQLEACIADFPDHESLSEANSDYGFFDQWFAVAHEKLTTFDEFKDEHDPSYAEKDEKARRKKLLETEGTKIADYINSASRSLQERFNSILSDSAKVDDFVSAEELKWGTRNLPVFASDFLTPAPQPAALVMRSEPVLKLPNESFFTRLPLISTLHKKQVTTANARFEADHRSWMEEKRTLPERQKQSLERWMEAESKRKERLNESQTRYDAAVQEWLQGVTSQNTQIDQLFAKASQGDPRSVEEYFAIVFSSASYPSEFRPQATFRFESSSRELAIALSLPEPRNLEKLVTYKYQKGSMTLEQQSPTAAKVKSLYLSLVSQLVVRVGHEVAEADRGRILQGISVHANIKDFDPLSNQETEVLVAQVVSSAEKWRGINVEGAEGKAMLKVLGGEISANPAEKLKLSPKGSIGRA